MRTQELFTTNHEEDSFSGTVKQTRAVDTGHSGKKKWEFRGELKNAMNHQSSYRNSSTHSHYQNYPSNHHHQNQRHHKHHQRQVIHNSRQREFYGYQNQHSSNQDYFTDRAENVYYND